MNKRNHAENKMVRSLNWGKKKHRFILLTTVVHMSLKFREHHRDNRMWAERPLMTVWAGGGMRGGGERDTEGRASNDSMRNPCTGDKTEITCLGTS